MVNSEPPTNIPPEINEECGSDDERCDDDLTEDEEMTERRIDDAQDARIDESDERSGEDDGFVAVSDDISVESYTIEDAPEPATRSKNEAHVQAHFQPKFKGQGPTAHIPAEVTDDPLSFVKLYLIDTVITTLTDSSNAYAHTVGKKIKHKVRWDITVDEMWCFI